MYRLYINLKSIVLIILILLLNFSCSNKNSLYKKGRKYEEQEDYKQAIKYYNKILEKDSTYINALAHRMRCYRKIGEYEKAMKEGSRLAKNDWENVLGRKEAGVVCAILGYHEKAFDYFDDAIEIDSTYLPTYNARGSLYYMIENYQLAIRDFNIFLAADSMEAVPWYNRGICYLMLDEYDKAIADFNKAIEKSTIENDHQYYYNRGVAYLFKKEYEKAISDLKIGIQNNNRQDPFEEIDNSWAYYYLGLSKIALGSIEDGCAALQYAIMSTGNATSVAMEDEDTFCESIASKEVKEAEAMADSILNTVFDELNKNNGHDTSNIDVEIKFSPNPISIESKVILEGIQKPIKLIVYDYSWYEWITYDSITDGSKIYASDYERGIYRYEGYSDEEIVASGRFIITK